MNTSKLKMVMLLFAVFMFSLIVVDKQSKAAGPTGKCAKCVYEHGYGTNCWTQQLEGWMKCTITGDGECFESLEKCP